MELILFIGVQATGKSTFYRERFFRTHVRLNLDMLKTRHRLDLLFQACLDGKTRMVIDNTNLTAEERGGHIRRARLAGFEVRGFFFESRVADAQRRNSSRPMDEQVPELAIPGSSKRLEIPKLSEGFSGLSFVRIDPELGFVVESWRDEV